MHTELSHFIRAGDFWYVNDEVGKEAGFLSAYLVTEEDKQTPPMKRWTYWDGSKWHSDPKVVCSREVTLACSEIIVELKGEAKEKRPKGSPQIKKTVKKGDIVPFGQPPP